MRRFLHGLLLICLLLTGIARAAELRLASWNSQNLGWGGQKSFSALGAVGALFDFLAVQEAMTEGEGIGKLHRALERASGEVWGRLESHALGRGSYQEHYAFLGFEVQRNENVR